ncbi:MAG: helix-turn-helix transcriptional regulator [Syntrophaceae bacterium]|nr:helix-turn-helix transcriptional regulator [Syntrophaceae bacterium]
MTPEELKQWREANGYSQKGLARALSCHVMTISRWERGAREIPSFLKLALGYLELKGDKTELKPTKPEKDNAVVNEYGEYLQAWNRLLESVFPKW